VQSIIHMVIARKPKR